MTTTMVSLEKFLPFVLPQAPECPAPLALQYLRLAASEFCQDARCWRETFTVSVTAQDEEITAPTASNVVAIESAFWEDRKLIPAPFHDFDPADFISNGGTPTYITQQNEDTLRLVPFAAGNVVVTAFLKPIPGIDTDDYDTLNVVPDFLFTNHAKHLADGALAHILSLPRRAYTDASMAAVSMARFEHAKAKATAKSFTGQQRARIRVKGHYF